MFASYASEIRGEPVGTLILGASSDPEASRVGAIVSRLRCRCPNINIEVNARPSSGNRHGLRAGELDVGIFLVRAIDPELSYLRLTTERFVVAGPAAWRDQIERADWQSLSLMPWATPSSDRMAYAVMLGQLFGDRGLELNSVVRFDNEANGRAMVSAGVALMLVREAHALRGVADGTFAIAAFTQVEFPLCMAFLASRAADPLIRAFEHAVRDVWKCEPSCGSASQGTARVS